MQERTRDLTRFLSKVDQTEGCWLWTGKPGQGGYGIFYTLTNSPTGRLKFYAHRWAYANLVGPIPEGYEIDHLCRERTCVNPEHLEAVTKAENNRRSESRSAENARKTHCIRGHEFSSANTYVRKDRTNPSRQCRACQRIRLGRAA